jgi:AraC family transcriptional activator of pyochelin receptor
MPTSIKISNTDRQKFEWVRSFILQDITVHHTIDYLAHRSKLNTFKLKKGFKLLYGESLYDFLQNKRLNLAIHLLKHSEESIQDIAEQCGYGYSTNFIAAFKRKYKVRPNDFRKVNQITNAFTAVEAKPCHTALVQELFPQTRTMIL